MNDQLGLFDRHGDDETGELDLTELRAALTQTAAAAPPPPSRRSVARREHRVARQKAAKRRKRRVRHSIVALLVLAVIAGGIFVGFKIWRKDSTAIPDFSGPGTAETVVRVGSGDTLTDIAETLADDNVVASPAAFVDAASGNSAVNKIKTGFYKVRLRASAAAAVTAMTDSAARVGQLRLIPGIQLADVTTRGGTTVTPGYITAITKAACVPLNGISNCFTADQLWHAAETADPARELGVPSWAVADVLKAPNAKKRLEGLLVPGDYDVPPGSTPVQALYSVISASTVNWNATDVVAGSKAIGKTPYEIAVIASLVEREGHSPSDMPQIARVIYNRLSIDMKLQLDSTVDYALGHSQISTTAGERATPSPYNTYFVKGLTPTPITSPGANALDAALNPAAGNWLFFVKVDKQNDFCFSATFAEHTKCVDKARANGVFDG